MVFDVFLLWCSSRKAVFCSFVREDKSTWIHWRTNWKRLSVTHEHRRRVLSVFFNTPFCLITKTVKTLFVSFGTLCLCSAIVMNLAVSKLPPSSCQYHNISYRIQSFQKENHKNRIICFWYNNWKRDSVYLKKEWWIYLTTLREIRKQTRAGRDT